MAPADFRRETRGASARDVIFAKERAGGAGPACDVDAALERQRDTVKRAERLVLNDCGLSGAGLCAGTSRVQMDKGVEFGLKGFDAAQMGFDKFDGRDFF